MAQQVVQAEAEVLRRVQDRPLTGQVQAELVTLLARHHRRVTQAVRAVILDLVKAAAAAADHPLTVQLSAVLLILPLKAVTAVMVRLTQLQARPLFMAAVEAVEVTILQALVQAVEVLERKPVELHQRTARLIVVAVAAVDMPARALAADRVL